MMHFPLTLNWLRDRAAKFFGTAVVVSRLPGGQLLRHTYQDIARRSLCLARALVQAGIRPGERVATLMWNHHAHLEAYFGVPAAGAVLHTLNHRLAASDLAYIIDHAQDRILLVDDAMLEVWRAVQPLQRSIERVAAFNFSGALDNAALPDGVEPYEAWLAQGLQAETTPLPALSEDMPASLCYTGGSTGRPKGVVYSHRGLVLHAFCQAMTDGYGLGRQDTILAVVPMFHGNGWGLPFVAALTGARLVLPGPRLDPDSVLDLIAAEGVTFSAGVPTVWLEVARALESNPGRWPLAAPLAIITGGATPPAALFDRLGRFGVDLRQGWGMTETASVITVSAPDRPLSASPAATPDQAWRHKQGKPMAMVDIRIAEQERELPMDGASTGEIQVRGACVSDGYFNQDLAQRWTADGWLRTGDVGTLDAHGNLQIFDRTEDMIKSGGEWIVPAELEHAISEYPGVCECTVIAIPHPKWGERPLALLVLGKDATLDEHGLRQHLLARFAKWQLPDAFIVLDALPRTAVGKVARKELRARYAQEMETFAAPTA